MTALIFSLAPEQVTIAMDTLVTDTSGTPIGYTSKLFPLLHLNGVMCVTGLSNLAADWNSLLLRFIARDIKHMDEFATVQLQEIWTQYADSVPVTSTVYHFGYDEEEKQYIGFAYRSEKGFASERLGHVIGIKPPISNASLTELKDFVTTMKNQREAEDSKPLNARVHIGGEVQLAVLHDGVMTLSTVYRWHDYDDMYMQMCRQFPIS